VNSQNLPEIFGQVWPALVSVTCVSGQVVPSARVAQRWSHCLPAPVARPEINGAGLD